MSDRLDRAIAALDVGLQDSPESHVYSDVAPTMVDECVRCQRRDRFDDSDWCQPCRAYLLGDGPEPDMDMAGWMTNFQTIRAPRGGIRYVPPPDFVQWDRDVRMGIARTELTEWSDVAHYVDQLRREEHLPESLPLRVTIEPRDHLGVTLSVEWSSAALALTSTLDVGLWRDSSIMGPRNDLQLFTEEWISFVGWGTPPPCPDAREVNVNHVVRYLDGNRWNNSSENLAVVDPRENVRGATADVARQIQEAAESFRHRNQVADDQIDATRQALASALQPVAEFLTDAVRRFVEWGHEAGIIDEDGQLTEPWRSIVERQRDARLTHDLAIFGEAFTDEDGNHVPFHDVRMQVEVVGDFRDATMTGPIEFTPPTGDPFTDPVARARQVVARRLAEYRDAHPEPTPFPSVDPAMFLDPTRSCSLCDRGEPWDISIDRSSELNMRNEIAVNVDHLSGPCERGGMTSISEPWLRGDPARFQTQRGH